MNKLLSGFILISLGLAGGYFMQPFVSEQLQMAGLLTGKANSDSMGEPKILYWVAPMDASYRRDKPGKSPMGMDLVPVYEKENKKEPEILYWVAPMDANYRRDKPGKSPMGMDLVPVYADEEGEDGVVKISPEVQNNLGVRIDSVNKGKLDREINTVGYIAFDEEKLFHLHTRVEGWVEKLLAKATGDVVKKDQKLFELYSPALVNAQEEYLTALRSKNKLLIQASRDRLASLGVSQWQIDQVEKTGKVRQRIEYFAKNDGFIENLKIREGMFIKPSMDVLTIGQIDTVWVIAEVFERQSGWVRKGQTVDMTVAAYPEKTWQGVLDYIYPVLDEKTRTLRVRIRFDNPDEQLKPNMFSRLTIHSNVAQETLLVKREAIIRNGQMERVVKALGDGKFLSVAVKTGSENAEFIEIIQGLEENDRIVTSAQFLIDSESSLSASFERMQEPEKMNEMATMDSMSSMSSGAREETQVWIDGQVKSVMPGHHMLSIQHQPVEAWGWPQMLMDFNVRKEIDLGKVKAEDPIRFLVEKHSNGSIEIVDIEQESAR